MNILFLAPYPLDPGRVVGGVEAVTHALAISLAVLDEVDSLTILCFHNRPGYGSGRLAVDRKLQVLYYPAQRRLNLPTRSFFDYRIAARIARTLQPDIIHSQGIGLLGDIAIRLTSKPVVTVHGLVHVEGQLASKGLSGRARVHLLTVMVRRILSRASLVISTSSYDARNLGVQIRGRGVYIPNPVAPEFFQAYQYNGDSQYFLFAGVMARRKNITGLLKAFAQANKSMPGIRLKMVGPMVDPVYLNEIESQIESDKLQNSVQLVGHVSNEELLQVLRGCRALVLFSSEETSPTIIAQALAVGKPVIASRVGGIPDLVKDEENGLLVDPMDEQALARCIVELYQSKDSCVKMGMSGHEFACNNFEPGLVAQKTVNAYQSILE